MVGRSGLERVRFLGDARDAEPTPLSSTGAIASCTWRVNRLDVFTRAVDGNLYHAWWDGSWDRD